MVEEGFGAVETLPRCWMAWAVTAIWPLIFLTGENKSLPLLMTVSMLFKYIGLRVQVKPLC